jgi:hypothetical protein
MSTITQQQHATAWERYLCPRVILPFGAFNRMVEH